MDEQVNRCILEIKNAVNAIERILSKHQSCVYSKDTLMRILENESDFMLVHIFVQDRLTGTVSAAVLDAWDGEFVAVLGAHLFYFLRDYGDTWIAWNDVPTQEQMDTIRWPKCAKNQSLAKSNYLFGEEKHHG